MASRLPRAALIAVFLTTALWLVYHSRGRIPYSAPQKEPSPEQVVDVPRFEAWGIRDLGEIVQISSIRVRPTYRNVELPTKQDADIAIVLNDINVSQSIEDMHSETSTILAPVHQEVDASSLIIGLATELDRLRDALPSFSHWASGTKVRFVILVKPAVPGGTSLGEIQQLYADHDIQIRLIESDLPWYDQYVSLLAVLYDNADPTTKWAVIMDDDTYFFSMKRVLAMLDKYNPNESYYIGGLSENKWSMDSYGYLAYGGAGVFLSMPLLKQLRPYNKECIAMPDDAGDWRVNHCITTYSLTKFTWEHYLFQMDLHGDVTGFYEAARTRPISTHHWKSWHRHDMAQVGAVGKICGNECVLQKYVLPGGWMMTNGFSIVKYSWTEEENSRYIGGTMEHTWADTAWVIPTSWNYTLAPLRPRDEGKIQYVIEKVDEEDNAVTLYYVRRIDGIGRGIIRMTWEKPPRD